MDEPDELGCPDPPSPVAVARRALILSAVVCRANLEHYTDQEYRQQTAEFIHEWLDELDLWPHVEPDEHRLIRAPFGRMPHELSVRGTWYVEGLAILAWALRRIDFPPHDQKVDAIAVTDALEFLSLDAGGLLESPSLRGPEELEAVREWFYDVHCSLRLFLFHGGDGHLAPCSGQYVQVLGLDAKSVMSGNGLAFEGKPLAEADRERLEGWEHVICERHRAAMWLYADEPYTEISVDT